MSSDVEFGKLRSYFWPIYSHEVKKLVPMALMLFLICFNYGILRNMKDSVVIPAAGAEVIPFIKVWVILPAAIILTYIYTKLANRFSQERVFYLITSGFLLFFALFAFVLYPLKEVIHPFSIADSLESALPAGFRGLIAMFRYWSFTGFYVISELWSTIVLSVLFWGFANEVTRLAEVSRFYSVCSVASNIAVIAAGCVSILFAKGQEFGAVGVLQSDKDWENTVMILTGVVIASGVVTMSIFRWMMKNVLSDSSYDDLQLRKTDDKKTRLSLVDSIALIGKSKYLLCIAILVIGYNLVINIVEVVWKDKVSELYPKSGDFNHYLSILLIIHGAISTITSFFMYQIIGKFGWTGTALITPILMLITSAGFFGFLLFGENLPLSVTLWLGASPLALAVFFGSAQNCLSKAAKYSVFDTTKEMTFVPLSQEARMQGKAAIDGVGSRLGKSGSSLVHQGLLMCLTTVSASVPYVAAILLIVIVLWIYAGASLGKQFGALSTEPADDGIGKKQAPGIATAAVSSL